MRLFCFLLLAGCTAEQTPFDDSPCGNPRSTCALDADCGEGACVALVEEPGGLCRCQASTRYRAPQCIDGPSMDIECCEHAACAEGQYCQGHGYDARGDYCNGIPPRGGQCLPDEPDCVDHADCAEGLCVPAGLLGYRRNTCVAAACQSDADCSERAGGQCSLLYMECNPGRFTCTYADDECRERADCEHGAYCVSREEGPTCLAYAHPA